MAGITALLGVIKKIGVGDVAVKKVSVGDVAVWSAFDSVGFDKNGNQTIPTGWTTLTGWTPRTGFPGSILTGDGILVPAGQPVNVTASSQHNFNNGHTSNACRVMGGATVLATSPSGGKAPTVTFAYTPTVDTILTVQSYTSAALSGNEVILGNSNTFLTVTVAT